MSTTTEQTMDIKTKLAKAMYYAYEEATDSFFLDWLRLTEREQAGWLAVAEMAMVLVNSAKATGEGLEAK